MDKEIEKAYNFIMIVSIVTTLLLMIMVVWSYVHQEYFNAVFLAATAGITFMNIFTVVLLKIQRKHGRTFH